MRCFSCRPRAVRHILDFVELLEQLLHFVVIGRQHRNRIFGAGTRKNSLWNKICEFHFFPVLNVGPAPGALLP